jgi:hypothetical protein
VLAVSAGAAAAGAAPRQREAGGRRARVYRHFDPHTALDLRRKLTPNECCQLLDLRDRLRYIEGRLETIAARHYERI